VWFVALPHAANQPDMAAHLEFLDDNGVDPSAMYYTELEMMKPIFERLALENRKADGPGEARPLY